MAKTASAKRKNVLILVETSRGYGRDLIGGITLFATEKKNWNMFLCDQISASRNARWLNAWKGDGVIARAFDANLKNFLREFRGAKINLAADGKEFPIYVRLDNEQCGRLAARHFWDRGYRNFAYFSMGYTDWSRYRYDCFVAGLKQFDAECFLCPQARRKNSETLPTLWWQGLDDSVFAWIESLPKPVGVFCSYDNHAFYLTNLCSSLGVAVPEEVAILGVDNDESLCRTTNPPMSSIDPNAHTIGYQAASLLERMMNRETLPPLPMMVEPSSIATRQSTDNIAVNDPKLVQAMRYIRNETARNIRVNDVAREIGVSKGTLNNLFRRHLHCSPIEEILRVRMEWAKELLRDTLIPMTEIAEMIGYQTSEYFSRAFTREVGLTPKQYRFSCQKNVGRTRNLPPKNDEVPEIPPYEKTRDHVG